MSRMKQAMRRVVRSNWFPAVGKHVVPRVDRFLHKISGGRIHLSDALVPTLLLTTIGRKSGQERRVPLLYMPDGERFVVVASNWAQPHHPAWSHNLLANPQATVEAKGKRWEVTARLADDTERAALWPRLTEVWPAYEDYAEKAGRELRIFLLEPR